MPCFVFGLPFTRAAHSGHDAGEIADLEGVLAITRDVHDDGGTEPVLACTTANGHPDFPRLCRRRERAAREGLELGQLPGRHRLAENRLPHCPPRLPRRPVEPVLELGVERLSEREAALRKALGPRRPRLRETLRGPARIGDALHQRQSRLVEHRGHEFSFGTVVNAIRYTR